MRTSRFICGIFFWVTTLSCADPHPHANTEAVAETKPVPVAPGAVADSFPRDSIVPRVTCRSDIGISYAAYIPGKNEKGVLPVMYFFDPHGNGALPLTKYKSLADRFGFILIGSNDSRNGNDWTTTENIWTTIFADSRSRLDIDTNRIYIAGFSGGAKVASYIALNHRGIKGVIANGAGLPDGTLPGDFNFSFTAVTGEGDMNMTDLVDLNQMLDKTQTRHRIIFFEGKHEWAPPEVMQEAFEGVLFDAMHRQLVPADPVLIQSYAREAMEKVDAYCHTRQLISARRECDVAISMLNGLSASVNWFKQKKDSLVRDTNYQNQLTVLQQLLATEEKMKGVYNRQFTTGDLNYWTKTITDLQEKARGRGPDAAMYNRLLAYLSLAFYSFSNQLISNNQNTGAEYFVTLYKMADPGNSEAWYFSALLHARQNDPKDAQEDLLKAVENGFNDENRMTLQPEFQSLSGQIDFARIEKAMQRNR